MSDLFAGFGSNSNNSGTMGSQQEDVLASLLQQHQLSQALKQQQEREQNLKSFGTSSLFMNKVKTAPSLVCERVLSFVFL